MPACVFVWQVRTMACVLLKVGAWRVCALGLTGAFRVPVVSRLQRTGELSVELRVFVEHMCAHVCVHVPAHVCTHLSQRVSACMCTFVGLPAAEMQYQKDSAILEVEVKVTGSDAPPFAKVRQRRRSMTQLFWEMRANYLHMLQEQYEICDRLDDV